MNVKIYTVADRIRNGFISQLQLKNMQEFAKSENMLLKSISLRDGTTAKILSNAIEYDCLIMKNGKVLTARGKGGTADDVATGILGLFEHIQKRRRASENVDVEFESFSYLDNYLKQYDKFLSRL